MKQVSEAIAELMLRHNCVIIPSFGGFVANIQTAQIDYSKGIIAAPKKALSFNTNLVNNDGLLANYLAQQNGITFSDSALQINKEVQGWNNLLKQGERVELEKIGFLYLDAEQNLNFEQDRFFNLLLSSYGMGNVQFVAEKEVDILIPDAVETVAEKVITPILTVSKVQEEVKTEVVAEKEILPLVKQEKKKRTYWKYAAAAIFIPIAFYSFWIPMKTDVLESGVLLTKDFNPFGKTSEAQYKEHNFTDLTVEQKEYHLSVKDQVKDLPKELTVFSYRLDEDKYIPVKFRETAPIISNSITSETKTVSSISEAKYHLIGGCFGSKSNALSLVNQMQSKGLKAKILDKNKGLYRVSIAQATKPSEIKNLKSTLASQGISSWLLTK